MTPEQEKDLTEIINTAKILINDKYRRGQAEHGGNLFDLSMLDLIDAATDEAIDQFTYLITLRKKLVEFKEKHGSNTNKGGVGEIGVGASPVRKDTFTSSNIRPLGDIPPLSDVFKGKD